MPILIREAKPETFSHFSDNVRSVQMCSTSPNIRLCSVLPRAVVLFVAHLVFVVLGHWQLGLYLILRTVFPTSRNSTLNSLLYFKLALAYTETR